MKRNLDDQAKIFSLSFNKKDTSIFRLTTTLKNKIDEKYLRQALDRTLKKYKDYKVKLNKDLFWYYLEENEKSLPIHNEIDYEFTKINTEENNNHLVRIAYEDNTLVVDFFHLLTDGANGLEFIKDIIYNYSRLNNHKLKPQEKRNLSSENAYTNNYTHKFTKVEKIPKAFQLQGDYIPTSKVSFNDFYINLNEIKQLSKEKECSISILLISLLVYSIYETNYKSNNGKLPINISIPISLKKYFPSDTISNFVSHSMLSIKPNKNDTLDNIIDLVKKDYTDKMTEGKIKDTFESDGKKINNKLLNIIPLSIKRAIVQLGAKIVKKQFTITYSNLGIIDLNNGYEEYTEDITFKLIPDWAERVRCGICSYKNDIIISFGSNLLDTSLEQKFQETLSSLNISHTIKSNEVNPIKKD